MIKVQKPDIFCYSSSHTLGCLDRASHDALSPEDRCQKPLTKTEEENKEGETLLREYLNEDVFWDYN